MRTVVAVVVAPCLGLLVLVLVGDQTALGSSFVVALGLLVSAILAAWLSSVHGLLGTLVVGALGAVGYVGLLLTVLFAGADF